MIMRDIGARHSPACGASLALGKRLLLQLYKLSYSVKLLGSVALLNPLHSYLAFGGLGERPTQDSGAQGFRHLSALM
ncbi:hypothetical protein PHYSODRAFT_343027 [Phytophthora sojae]|uniref:Uncharacterized protein n=1 Tax=Phytophthora sojae (strain P6497) TaxID=1094619 RepID=G5AID1_PHYSP|nr:hypothetical protein PHYSODRAFT_343027 [Phytophthora sojae]EGZ04733.1 hypothetical protein PHYSODRAFT_343027 [Phytophthora sojae]|eukprot:XP_009539832.1 hypothetical protein PHYSODRAFT_343027 [Phytophthora sojae]